MTIIRHPDDDVPFNPEPYDSPEGDPDMNETIEEQTTVAQELLTEEEQSVLADARKTLKDITERARKLSFDDRVKATKGWDIDMPSAFDIGMFHAKVQEAENAIFEAMNVANAYCKVEIPETYMHPHR